MSLRVPWLFNGRVRDGSGGERSFRVIFVTLPAARTGSLVRALATGAFFGLVAYATHDLTNLATLKGWPVTVTVVDIRWGMVLTASVAAAGYAVAR